MSIETGIVARLAATSAVTSLVKTRIYANVLPDGISHPAIVYQLISTLPIDSVLGSDGGKLQSRVQFTLIADTTSGRVGLANALNTALQRYQGAADDVTILDSRLENIFDQAYDRETDEVARVADYLIYYE